MLMKIVIFFNGRFVNLFIGRASYYLFCFCRVVLVNKVCWFCVCCYIGLVGNLLMLWLVELKYKDRSRYIGYAKLTYKAYFI